MKFVIEVKDRDPKQAPHIKQLVEEFCRNLPQQIAIDGCSCVEVKKKPAQKKAKEVKDGQSAT